MTNERTPQRRVYLDWNATAPPLEASLHAMAEAAKHAWGNPSSVHADGRAARALVEGAREAVAEIAGADPRDVVLTSGGTEANNLALRSAFAPRTAEGARTPSPPVLVTSRIEHPSVTRVAEALEREGAARVRWLAVRPDGRVDVEDLARALREGETRLIALQAVNHETGVVQPIEEASSLAREHGVWLHVDAVQAWGRMAAAATVAADTKSLAAHKLRGPKGIGALVTRAGLRLEPILLGGAQERGIRPGTVDGVAAAGLTAAVKHAAAGGGRYAAIAPLRDALERALLSLARGAQINGHDAPRVPHVSSVAFAGWSAPELVAALDLEGVSVSSGPACSSGKAEASAGLRVVVGEARALSTVRLSLGETTTAEEVEVAIAAFRRVIARMAPAAGRP